MADLVATPAHHGNDCTSSPTSLDHKQEGTHELSSRDRDSGVFMSDSESAIPSTPIRSTTAPITPVSSLRHTPSTKAATPSRSPSTLTDRRLRRPVELNLGSQSPVDSAKPKSELELRYDLIRNSSTRSKAALKSPTQLLKDRLNLSPKKTQQEKIRTFTPPRPMLNGCILPGPTAHLEMTSGTDVKARTEKEGRPSWWCKFDKLVVFDGVDGERPDGEVKYKTRTSKGLSIARRRGDCETIVIPMDCAHCCEMLNRSEWKYDMRVCKRTVCWDCKERCRWESELEAQKLATGVDEPSDPERDSGRYRADSVLQDQDVRDEELMLKAGIEMGPKSPIEAVGGIGERLQEPDHQI